MRIQFRPSGSHLIAEKGTTLHAAVCSAALPIASACSAEGLCARCGLEVLGGAQWLSAETSEERRAKDRNRIDPELRLACLTRIEGRNESDEEIIVTARYW